MSDSAPWYRHFWPWFLIGITGSAIVGGMLTLFLAISNPDYLVVSETEYQQIRSDLKADPADAEDDSGHED